MGPHRELSVLLQRAQAAAAGEGGLALLSGPAGIGTTRLAAEAAASARERGVRVVSADCGGGTFGLWTQVLRAALVMLPIGVRPPEAAELAPLLDPGAAAADGNVPDRRAAAARQLLMRAGSRHGLLVVVDGVERADPSSLRLLRSVASALVDAPLLLVATRTTGALEGWRHTGLLAELNDAATLRVGLQGLDPGDAEELLRQWDPAATRSSARALHEHTGGNPLFLREATRAALAVDELPGSLAATARSRVDRLDPESKAVLAAAAVLGDESDVRTLTALTGRPAPDVVAALAPAAAAGMIVDSRLSAWRFAHVVHRQACLSLLRTTERTTTHDRILDILGADAQDEPARAEALAVQAVRAVTSPATRARALRSALAAAWAARRRGADDTAAAWYRTALDFGPADSRALGAIRAELAVVVGRLATQPAPASGDGARSSQPTRGASGDGARPSEPTREASRHGRLSGAGRD